MTRETVLAVLLRALDGATTSQIAARCGAGDRWIVISELASLQRSQLVEQRDGRWHSTEAREVTAWRVAVGGS
jgi:hypothetical protein